jgi:hypothetical protein
VFFRKRRHKDTVPVDISLVELGETFKKSGPACACCGYDAEWLLKLGSLEKLFCERDLLNALFDALNFNLA